MRRIFWAIFLSLVGGVLASKRAVISPKDILLGVMVGAIIGYIVGSIVCKIRDQK
jgi:hypothetical protein